MKTLDIFDFDGVLAEPFEEALFTMPETEHDDTFVKEVSGWAFIDLDLSLESKLSQRYICIQAVLRHILRVDVEPGPMFKKAGMNPFHIMTARCDRFAVPRVHDFVAKHGLNPIKVMHTDHLPKGIMLQTILDRHPDVRINFYDDTQRHIDSALSLNNPRLNVFKVDNDMQPYYDRAIKFYNSVILEEVL